MHKQVIIIVLNAALAAPTYTNNIDTQTINNVRSFIQEELKNCAARKSNTETAEPVPETTDNNLIIIGLSGYAAITTTLIITLSYKYLRLINDYKSFLEKAQNLIDS